MEQKDSYEQLKLERQLCFPLYACARKVVNHYTPYLKPLHITYTQYLVFLVLWEQDGISVGELGEKLYLDNGTLTQKGHDLRRQAKEIPKEVSACLPLSPEDARLLYQLLYRVLLAL